MEHGSLMPDGYAPRVCDGVLAEMLEAFGAVEDGQLLGVLFESLCMHDLAVYASALPDAGADPLHYYRDSDGLEIDAVIELRDGRWAGIEVKLGESGVAAGAASLNRLRRKVAANPPRATPSPSSWPWSWEPASSLATMPPRAST